MIYDLFVRTSHSAISTNCSHLGVPFGVIQSVIHFDNSTTARRKLHIQQAKICIVRFVEIFDLNF